MIDNAAEVPEDDGEERDILKLKAEGSNGDEDVLKEAAYRGRREYEHLE